MPNFLKAELLHPEVETIPGKPGDSIDRDYQGGALYGSAVLRLTNPLTRINAYSIRIECEDKAFWNQEWYQILPLGSALSQDDQPGPGGRTLTMRVAQGTSRDAVIRFSLPRNPESRAGRYSYRIIIAAELTANDPAQSGFEDPTTTLNGVLVVRPYYDWEVYLLPSAKANPAQKTENKGGVQRAQKVEKVRLSRFHPKTEYEAVVRNAGNDWLYCELIAQINVDNFDVEMPTLRAAIPPAEKNGGMPRLALPEGGLIESRPGRQRTFPLTAKTGLRKVWGTDIPQGFILRANRLEAPSLPPSQGVNANVKNGGVTLMTPFTHGLDNQPIRNAEQPRPADIEFHPFPSNVLLIPGRILNWVRANVMFVVGMAIAIPAALVIYQRAVYGALKITALEGLKAGSPVRIKGKLLTGSVFQLVGVNGKGETVLNLPQVESKRDPKSRLVDLDEVMVDIPKEAQNTKISLVAIRRFPFLSFLPDGIWPKSPPYNATVGDLAASIPPEVSGIDPTKPELGSTFKINGKNLKKDQLLMNGKSAAALVVAETEGGLQVQTPDKIGKYDFKIKYGEGTKDVGQVTVVPAPQVAGETKTPAGGLKELAPGESVPTVDGVPLPVVKVGDKSFVKMPAGKKTITTVKNGKPIKKVNDGGAPPRAYKNEEIFPVFLAMVDAGDTGKKTYLPKLEEMVRSRDEKDPVFNLVMGSIDWREPKKDNLTDFWFLIADNSIDKISTPDQNWKGLLDAERGFHLADNDLVSASEWLEKSLKNFPKYLKANAVLVQIYAYYLDKDPMGKDPNGIENLKPKASALLKRMDDSGITDAIKAKYTGDTLDKIVASLTTIRNTSLEMK